MDKIICGGRFFTNPHREPKPRDINPWEKGSSMGACRGFTLCEGFRDWDDCTFKFFEITCPECMVSDIYMKWLRRLTVLRLNMNKIGPGMARWDYRFHRDIKIAIYIDMDCHERKGGLVYE